MSAITLILPLAAASAAGAGVATAYYVRALRREVAGLREELRAPRVPVPAARQTPALEEIRAAVADALAEERERELAEARAFWVSQEQHEAETTLATPLEAALEYEVSSLDAALLDSLLEETAEHAEEPHLFLPRQPSSEEVDSSEPATSAGSAGSPGQVNSAGSAGSAAMESPDMRAARRRHPSDPNFSLSGEPVVPAPAPAPEEQVVPGTPTGPESVNGVPAEHDRTIERLGLLAEHRVALRDVRSGPLGTLDVYVFADNTTVCLTPGHRETADLFARALDEGVSPVLLGGSGVSGAYALTFACGEETVYVLADRVISSR